VKVGNLVRIINSSWGDDSLGIVVHVNKYNDADPKEAVHLICIEGERLWYPGSHIEVVSESR